MAIKKNKDAINRMTFFYFFFLLMKGKRRPRRGKQMIKEKRKCLWQVLFL